MQSNMPVPRMVFDIFLTMNTIIQLKLMLLNSVQLGLVQARLRQRIGMIIKHTL